MASLKVRLFVPVFFKVKLRFKTDSSHVSDRLSAPKTPSKPREEKDAKPTPPKATPPPRMQPAVPRVVPRDAATHKSPASAAANNKPMNKVRRAKKEPWFHFLTNAVVQIYYYCCKITMVLFDCCRIKKLNKTMVL